jgi:hypothetical protein
MKKNILKQLVALLILIISGFNVSSFAQIGVGINYAGAVPNTSALLDIDAGTGIKKGLLIPRIALVSSTDATTITAPAATLMVYNLGTGGLTPAGYYYNSGTSGSPVWVQLLNGGSPGTAWNVLGNTGTTAGTHFLGTTDARDLVFKTNNTEWMRILSGGNVGIGTTAPNYLLHIKGGDLFLEDTNDPKLAFGHSGNTIWASVYRESSTGKLFIKNDQGNPIIMDNGNVGIGTTVPTVKAHIYDAIDGIFTGLVIDNRKTYGAGTGTNEISRIILSLSEATFADPLNRVMGFISAGTESEASSADGFMAFGTRTLGTETEKMRITATGNVGIGTTGPGAKLHIKAVGDVGSSGEAFILERSGGSNKLIRMYQDANDGYIEVRTGGDAIISKISGYSASPTYFNSNIGIGTTVPQSSLHIAGTTIAGAPTIQGIHMGNNGTVPTMQFFGTGGQIIDFSSTSGVDADFRMSVNGSSMAIGASTNANGILINTSGYVGIGTASPADPLDVNNARVRGDAVSSVAAGSNDVTDFVGSSWAGMVIVTIWRTDNGVHHASRIFNLHNRYGGTASQAMASQLTVGVAYSIDAVSAVGTDGKDLRVTLSGAPTGTWQMRVAKFGATVQ